MTTYVRLYCQCGTQLHTSSRDYQHNDGTSTCRTIRPIRIHKETVPSGKVDFTGNADIIDLGAA
jgi:hypothetical protein